MSSAFSHRPKISNSTTNDLTGEDYVPMSQVDNENIQTSFNKSDDNYIFNEVNDLHDEHLVTSGTPSTDLRFSAYHLEKIISFLVPGEDLQKTRSLRAYSVGSRPEHSYKHRKTRLVNLVIKFIILNSIAYLNRNIIIDIIVYQEQKVFNTYSYCQPKSLV